MKKAYDIVVLGAGFAGCAAARALAQRHPGASIALLEQGRLGPWPAVLRVPALQPWHAHLPHVRPFLRILHGVPEASLAGRALTYTRGCGLGGTTVCNDMSYRRGTREDLRAWGQATWSFDALLPFFTALEHNTRGASAWHGGSGPVHVSDAHRCHLESGLNVRFFEACEAAGVPSTEDFNRGTTEGFSAYQSLVEAGRRVEVGAACLPPDAPWRTRLSLCPMVRAEALDIHHGRLRGLRVRHGRTALHLETPRVVVCLGALDTPALLRRSGLGAGGAVVDLPAVGQNLIQAASVDLVFRTPQGGHGVGGAALHGGSAAYMWAQWREYAAARTGIFASLGEAVAYVRSEPHLPTSDLSLALFRTPQLPRTGPVWRRCFDGFTLRVTHHYPVSRGSLTLTEAETGRCLRSALLTAPEDVASLEQGVKWVNRLVSPGSPLHAAPYHDPASLRSPEGRHAFLAQYAVGGTDLFGTCAMGSVVDDRLRVRGVEGVVVADASVVPTPTVASSAVLGAAIASRAATLDE